MPTGKVTPINFYELPSVPWIHELCNKRQSISFTKSVFQPLIISTAFMESTLLLIKAYWNWFRTNLGQYVPVNNIFKGHSIRGSLKDMMDHWTYFWSFSVPGKTVYHFCIASVRIPCAHPLWLWNFWKFSGPLNYSNFGLSGSPFPLVLSFS